MEYFQKTKDIDPDGWEYSKIFTTKFHPKERKFDMVRRRRYNRRMISDVPMPCVFQIIEEEAKADKLPKIINMAPRIITEYDGWLIFFNYCESSEWKYSKLDLLFLQIYSLQFL